MPKPTLRITEIPAENPHAWVDNLKAELARCATLGFSNAPIAPGRRASCIAARTRAGAPSRNVRPNPDPAQSSSENFSARR
ncbi:hypothetical protein WJ978_20375 [Achromobacter xylosoxidans]